MRDPRRRRPRRGLSPRAEARRLVRELPNVVKLLFRLIRDLRVPAADKLLFGFAVAYVLMPADLLPDFLGFLGVVDDLYLVGWRWAGCWRAPGTKYCSSTGTAIRTRWAT